MREKKSIVNVWLSPNSLILVKESHQKWVRFPLCSHVHVRQNFLEHLWNSFERLWTFFVLLSDPYKKSWHSQDQNVMLINLKKLLDSIHLHSLVSFNSIYFPVSYTRWQKFSTSKLWSMSPMLRNTMQAEILFHPGQKQKYSTFTSR